ncbi:MAG: acyl carrier protein [Mycobacteriales bacterium]
MTSEQSIHAAPATRDAIERELLSLLGARLRTPVTAEQDLFADGLITSMFAMQLVVQLEESFAVAIVGPDLKLANFRSVAAMADLVHRLRSASIAGSDGD